MVRKEVIKKIGTSTWEDKFNNLGSKVNLWYFDHEDKDLVDFMYDLTEEKIKIDNPKYKLWKNNKTTNKSKSYLQYKEEKI